MKKDYIEKIRKLLAVARADSGATQNEIQVALQKALAIMQEHDISESELGENPLEDIVEKIVKCRHPRSIRIRLINTLLRKFFHVRVILGSRDLSLFGRESHVEVAIYVQGFLDTAMQRAYRAARKRDRRTRCDAFWYGMYAGIYDQLDVSDTESGSERYAIVVRRDEKEIDDFINQRYSNLRTLSKYKAPKANASYYKGLREGENTRINPSIKSSPAKIQHLLTS